MKVYFLIIFTYSIYLQSQPNLIGGLIFNNNRITINLEKKLNKNFSFNCDFGVLCSDYFTPNRPIFIKRLTNSKGSFSSPYYYQKSKDCETLMNDGYKINVIGFKSAFNYYNNYFINKRKGLFFRFNYYIGIFYGKSNIKPLDSFIASNPTAANNCKVNFEIAGLFGGFGLSYFFNFKIIKNYSFGCGFNFPFYKPVTPYWYANTDSTPILSGLEPEIKLSIIKKIKQ